MTVAETKKRLALVLADVSRPGLGRAHGCVWLVLRWRRRSPLYRCDFGRIHNAGRKTVDVIEVAMKRRGLVLRRHASRKLCDDGTVASCRAPRPNCVGLPSLRTSDIRALAARALRSGGMTFASVGSVFAVSTERARQLANGGRRIVRLAKNGAYDGRF